VLRHHERLDRVSVPDRLLLTEGGSPRDHDYDAVWRLVPPFGPVPNGLSETYPLTAETPERTDRAACEAAADGVAALVAANPEVSVTVAHEDWPETALAGLPDGVETESLSAVRRGE
jgi:7-cyano-7-deazaguanine tRNA-ribosyltransferase